MVDGSYEEKLEIYKLFLSDSREMLDDIEPQIITMEEIALPDGIIDEGIINAVFRLFHSLKGSASFLELHNITRVTHEAETLLDLFRSGEAVISTAHIDLLIRAIDLIRKTLITVEKNFNDQGHEDEAAVIINDLRECIARLVAENNSPPSPKAETDPSLNTVADEVTPSPEIEEDFLSSPEMTSCFVEESRGLLDEAEKALLALERLPDNPEYADVACRAMHSIKGNAGFFGYGDLEEVSRQAEMILDQIRNDEKTCEAVTISFLFIAIDALRDGIQQVSQGLTPEVPGKKELVDYLNSLSGGSAGDSQNEDCTREQTANLKLEKEQGQPTAAAPDQGFVAKESAGAKQADNRTGKHSLATQQQAIRVDLEKIDKLLDLVGELVISGAMVASTLTGQQLERMEKAVVQLDKITRGIQEVAMSMRMIPLNGTFRKMVRLVRDLAQKSNKKVVLEIFGEETEVDKTIIEQISDPLVHIIRNALDHGIESPEERKALGKPETGRVTIEAKHSAGEVWIVVKDDGRGLDPEKIMRKALERGLIKSEEKDFLKDEEVWKLIFEPGFSTAEKLSDISGRGVGMDVVKRNIEKLRGKVDIRSKVGAGTIFIVRIPLTLAIIEGMVVKVSNNRYTIPSNSIRESLQPKSDQITRTPDGLEVVSIRGELLPVIRLHEFYRIKPVYYQLTDGILIVIETDERKCCLFVDEVVGLQQIVIKGLSSYLGRVRSVSGCAILEDGDISIILDCDELINKVEQAG